MLCSDSLEKRLKELNNTGALFETDAAKAEIEEVKTALAEARRQPGEFVVSFEHLRPAAYTPSTEELGTMLERQANAAGSLGGRINTFTDGCTRATSKNDQTFKERLVVVIDGLRRCEMCQSCTVQKALNLQECSKIYQHYYVDNSINSGSLSRSGKSWAALQGVEIQLQANRSIDMVSLRRNRRGLATVTTMLKMPGMLIHAALPTKKSTACTSSATSASAD